MLVERAAPPEDVGGRKHDRNDNGCAVKKLLDRTANGLLTTFESRYK